MLILDAARQFLGARFDGALVLAIHAVAGIGLRLGGLAAEGSLIVKLGAGGAGGMYLPGLLGIPATVSKVEIRAVRIILNVLLGVIEVLRLWRQTLLFNGGPGDAGGGLTDRLFGHLLRLLHVLLFHHLALEVGG